MSTDTQPSLKNAVLEKIQSGQAKMHSRLYFVTRAVLVVLGLVIVTGAVVYVVSFGMVVFHLSGSDFAATLGPRGWPIFLASFPWFLLLAVFIFIVLLEFIVKRYSFAYRTPLLYSVIGIAVVVFIVGYVVSRTSFHRGLYRYARDHHLPFVSDFYRGYGHEQLHEVQSGRITDTIPNGFHMTTVNGQVIAVVVLPDTNLVPGTDLGIGDSVVVVGASSDHTLQAFGIREVNDDFLNDTDHDATPFPSFAPPFIAPQVSPPTLSP